MLATYSGRGAEVAGTPALTSRECAGSFDGSSDLEATAHWIAAHALSLLAALMLLMLLATLAGWWLFERFGRRWWNWTVAHWQRIAALTPGAYLALHLVLGFAFALPALALFLELAEEIGDDQEEITRFDLALDQSLRQAVAPAVLRAFALLTHAGDGEVRAAICVLVAAWLLFQGRRLSCAAWITAVAGGGILNRALKAVFVRERPLYEHDLVTALGWSFPSGHASGALVLYGMLTYLSVRGQRLTAALPIVVAALVLIVAVGFSRVFLQVHYFSDVIAGFASGSVWLIVCITGTELALRHRARAAAATGRPTQGGP